MSLVIANTLRKMKPTIKTYNDREVILLNLIKEFRGRVFNTGGDSVFAEFSSAVDAVECAFTFQNKIHQINDIGY